MAEAGLLINQIVCGDCLEVMKEWPDNQIDTIITDPPYGLGFMGKEWDTFKPENVAKELRRDTRSHKRREQYGDRPRPSAAMAAARYDHSRNAEFQAWFTIWGKEALRILKPGGTLLIFGGTRTYHRLACAIEDAGFILKDCIMWLYGSGFPKATDLSLQFDKKACQERLTEKLGRKPATDELKKAWGDFRKVVGKNPNDRVRRENELSDYGLQGGVGNGNITEPATPEAQLWNGWKSHGLKPAYEPILVAMKPNDGTYAGNALKWGVSGLNIDGGRIEHNEPVKTTERKKNTGISWHKENCGPREHPTNIASPDSKGRFPANVILDEEAAAMLDEQSGQLTTGARKKGQVRHINNGDIPFATGVTQKEYPASSGGASRFFYCAKASKSERNAGCEGMDERQKSSMPGRRNPDDMSGYKIDNDVTDRFVTKQKNYHPTVKPLALMEYLCKLTKTPTGGVVLDCFSGSGTTAIACINTGRPYILIEKDPEYCEIAKYRLNKIKDKYALLET